MGFLQKFMYGRYGGDALGRFTLVLYLIFWLCALLTDWGVFYALDTVLAFITLFRMLSRNLPKRRAENEKYLSITAPVRTRWQRARRKHSDKAHKYFKCPNCGQQLRVPKGAGKIKVTCRNCGTSFEQTS